MTERMHNLLAEPLLRTARREGGVAPASLPTLLAWLTAGDVQGFPGLRAHQSHAWFAFLVQLAALALHADGEAEPVGDEADWRRRLLQLSGGVEEAWCLIVEDLSLPAFFQSPVPEGRLEKVYKKHFNRPDEIDVLITAKNHDVKQATIASDAVEQWIYALVTLQTMEGFSGRGNYGIARMNGGFGSRPAICVAPPGGWSARWQRDVPLLCAAREELVGDYGFADEGGAALVWTVPWDGTESLALLACDPFFIEIARRVRLRVCGDLIQAHMAATKGYRINVKELSGVVGDPWTPIDTSAQKSLTLAESGFTYRKTQDLLFGADWQPGVLSKPRTDEVPGSELLLQCLVRGQGKTGGYHERRIPVPPSIMALFALRSGDDFSRLGSRSRGRVELVSIAQRKVLHPALCALLQGGAETLDFRDERDQRWLAAFDQAVDQVFFPALWATFGDDDDAARAAWVEELRGLTLHFFQRAIGEAPIPVARRPRAIARAELLFHGSRNKHLPRPAEPQESP